MTRPKRNPPKFAKKGPARGCSGNTSSLYSKDALLFVKRRLGGVDFLATLRDEREDFSREVTLQRSNGVEFGMAFCDPTSNIILGSLIGP